MSLILHLFLYRETEEDTELGSGACSVLTVTQLHEGGTQAERKSLACLQVYILNLLFAHRDAHDDPCSTPLCQQPLGAITV